MKMAFQCTKFMDEGVFFLFLPQVFEVPDSSPLCLRSPAGCNGGRRWVVPILLRCLIPLKKNS